MSQYLTQLDVQQYTTNVALLLQQEGSVLRKTCMNMSHYGNVAAAVDQFVPVVASQVTAQYQPLIPYDTQNARRWVAPTDYQWIDLIDTFTELRLIIDPTSSYVRNSVLALGRSIDFQIINAFFGLALTGTNATQTIAFPSSQIVPVSTGSSGPTGLNVAKLRAAKQILLANYVDFDREEIWCAINNNQWADLMNEVQYVNWDYHSERPLEEGRVTRFMGVNFVHTEFLPANGSGYRMVPFYVKSRMHLGIWNDIQVRVSRREDLSSIPWQVYTKVSAGATRTEEKGIVQILCSEP